MLMCQLFEHLGTGSIVEGNQGQFSPVYSLSKAVNRTKGTYKREIFFYIRKKM
jgi:hypothetical protein